MDLGHAKSGQLNAGDNRNIPINEIWHIVFLLTTAQPKLEIKAKKT